MHSVIFIMHNTGVVDSDSGVFHILITDGDYVLLSSALSKIPMGKL